MGLISACQPPRLAAPLSAPPPPSHLRLLPTSASFRPIGPDHSAPLASLPSSQAAVTAGRHHRKPPLTLAAFHAGAGARSPLSYSASMRIPPVLLLLSLAWLMGGVGACATLIGGVGALAGAAAKLLAEAAADAPKSFPLALAPKSRPPPPPPPKPVDPNVRSWNPGGKVESSGAIAGGGGGTGGGGGGRSGPTACQSVGSGRVRGGGM